MNETKETYYAVTFRNYPNATHYAYGETALEAIENAKDGMFEDGYRTPYLSPRARVAVYKEWNYNANQYTNGGDFIR